MRSYLFVSALLGLTAAAPKPQQIDLAGVEAAPDPVFVTPAYNLQEQNGATNEPDITARSQLVRRDGNCASQPAGSGSVSSPDTPDAFLSNPEYAALANNAPTPDGYSMVMQNSGASLSASNYMGLKTLKSYDTLGCASLCDQAPGCQAYNMYIERDPTLDPNAVNCPNPPSLTNYKCTLWGSPVAAAEATNKGQWRDSFQVVIAGSNAYNKVSPPPGISCYTGPAALGGAINAPLNSQGQNTYMGYNYHAFSQSQGYDPSTCAADCNAQTAYNKRHPAADGSYQTCVFFNAYVLSMNGVPQGLYCSKYSQSWAASYATNYGQYRGSDRYTVSRSYSYSLNMGSEVCGTGTTSKSSTSQSTTSMTSTLRSSTVQLSTFQSTTSLAFESPTSSSSIVSQTTSTSAESSTTAPSTTESRSTVSLTTESQSSSSDTTTTPSSSASTVSSSTTSPSPTSSSTSESSTVSSTTSEMSTAATSASESSSSTSSATTSSSTPETTASSTSSTPMTTSSSSSSSVETTASSSASSTLSSTSFTMTTSSSFSTPETTASSTSSTPMTTSSSSSSSVETTASSSASSTPSSTPSTMTTSSSSSSSTSTSATSSTSSSTASPTPTLASFCLQNSATRQFASLRQTGNGLSFNPITPRDLPSLFRLDSTGRLQSVATGTIAVLDIKTFGTDGLSEGHIAGSTSDQIDKNKNLEPLVCDGPPTGTTLMCRSAANNIDAAKSPALRSPLDTTTKGKDGVDQFVFAPTAIAGAVAVNVLPASACGPNYS